MADLELARTDDQYRKVEQLMAEYVAWDRECVAAMGLDPEVMWSFFYRGEPPLPGDFAPPRGCLLLAVEAGAAVGCGAFRPLEGQVCELKRMFVRPALRGSGIGRALACALIERAAAAGHRTMRLETTTFMVGAPQLYRSLGFRPCAPYYDIPEMFRPITVFMERSLP